MSRDKKLILRMWIGTAGVVSVIMVFTLVSLASRGTLGVPDGVKGGALSNTRISEAAEEISVISEEPVALAASAEVSAPKEAIPGLVPLSATQVVRELRITIQKADGSYMAKYTGCSSAEQDIFSGLLDFERDGKDFHFSGVVGVQAMIEGDVEHRYYLIA
ncbi:MAG: hypothetical protein LBS91_05930 [Clostridiales Family XIII bacterium]|jgi:hypothetical protein|nr:hypothetical protein [Clostridiales Family XIII bacterium]